MNDKKSYLGSLNAGRERRSGAILDDITEKLDALERRIAGERTARPARPSQRPQPESAATAPQPRRMARANVYDDIARDLERARERSDEFGSISRISHDLQALREELRQEMSHGIRQEFDSLRRQMADFYQDVQSGLSSRELVPELERIAAGVSSLRYAHTAPEHRVDTNTRIDTTYADQAGVPPKDRKGGPGSPIRDPIKQKRPPNPKQVPELFSKAGVADWVNRPRKPDAAPGKDELWRPWHKQGRFFYSG